MRFYGIKPESLGQLGVLGRQIDKCKNDHAQIKVKFLRPYGIAYLDQVLLRVSGERRVELSSTYPEANRYLNQVGFTYLWQSAELGEPFPQQDIIRLIRFSGKPGDLDEKVAEWLGTSVRPFLPTHSPKLWKKIVENFWEIVNNALVHGGNPNGVSACGQFYPTMGYFEIAFYDYGVGIPSRVREFTQRMDITDHDGIHWAVQEGNSTQPFKESAGLGLHLLREFLTLNRGIFQIVSGNGYFGQDADQPPTSLPLKNSIEGTLVNMRVIFDDRLYQLRDEKQQ